MTRRFEIERRRSDVAFVPVDGPLERAMRASRVLLVGAGLLLAAGCQNGPAPSVQSEPPREPAANARPGAAAVIAAPPTATSSVGSAASPSAAAAHAAEGQPSAAAPGPVGLAKYQPAAADTTAADRRAEAPSASPTADAPTQAAAGQPIQGAAVSEEPFSIWLQAVSPIAAGSAATVEAVLVAKPPYHCNAEYPHKFKLAAAPSGLAYPETTVKGAKVTAEKSVLPIPVQAQSPGKAKVSGTLSFSVCNEDRCLVEKRDLAVELEVK